MSVNLDQQNKENHSYFFFIAKNKEKNLEIIKKKTEHYTQRKNGTINSWNLIRNRGIQKSLEGIFKVLKEKKCTESKFDIRSSYTS